MSEDSFDIEMVPPPLEFPISIALIGAPDSGKSQVAEAFMGLASDWFADHRQPLELIENAGTTIEERYDYAMGPVGGYRGHLWAHHVRYTQEKELLRLGHSFITCGAIPDNFAHAGLEVEVISKGIKTPQSEMKMMQAMHAATSLSFLTSETFVYTFAFYLPLGPEIVLPGGTTGEDTYNRQVDNALRVIFQRFGYGLQTIEGTVEERAQIIYDTMVNYMDHPELALAEERQPVSSVVSAE